MLYLNNTWITWLPFSTVNLITICYLSLPTPNRMEVSYKGMFASSSIAVALRTECATIWRLNKFYLVSRFNYTVNIIDQVPIKVSSNQQKWQVGVRTISKDSRNLFQEIFLIWLVFHVLPIFYLSYFMNFFQWIFKQTLFAEIGGSLKRTLLLAELSTNSPQVVPGSKACSVWSAWDFGLETNIYELLELT